MSGFGLEETLRAEGCRVPVVFVTAHDDAATRARGHPFKGAIALPTAPVPSSTGCMTIPVARLTDRF